MSSRTEMVAALQTQAEDMGWQVMELSDECGQVGILLAAPGASEQVAQGTLVEVRRQLNEMGGPEDYSLDEDYDLDVLPDEVKAMAEILIQHSADAEHAAEQAEIAEVLAEDEAFEALQAEVGEMDVEAHNAKFEASLLDDDMATVKAVAKAEGITATDAVNQLAYTENDPEWLELLAEIAAEDAAAEEAGMGDAEDLVVFEEFDSEPAAGVTEDGPYTALAAAELAQTEDEEASLPVEAIDVRDAAGEAETALNTAVEALTRKRDACEVRLERAKAVLRNIAENGHVSGDGLHEDISPYLTHENERPSMKSLWRNEVPRPNQFLEVPMTDRRIIARKDDQVKVFCSGVEADVKEGLEEEGFTFFHVTEEHAKGLNSNVAAQRTDNVVTVNGREVAPEGYRVQVSKLGHPTQLFKSIDPSVWVPRGFQVQLVEAGA